MGGRLLGIARRDRPFGAVETMEAATVTIREGVQGDFRGSLKPGRNKRQVTVIAAEDWEVAMADLGAPWLDWSERRANLLVGGIALPRETGARIEFSGGVILQVTGETTPCHRMEAIRPGLRAALTPDWRGGVTTRVIAGGALAIGDKARIEGP